MKQKWTLNIKDFGKISRADVEIAPFMLFVGENNTGKSYVMSLLWGLLAQGRLLFPKDTPSSEEYKACSDWITRNLFNERLVVDQEFQNHLLTWFNSILKNKKNELVKKIFASDEMSIGYLALSEFSRKKPLEIKWQEKDPYTSMRFSSGADYVRFPVGSNISEIEKYRMIQYITWKLLMDDLSAPLFPLNSTFDKRIGGESLYLPAARTGFMLTYKSLTAELMNSWSGQSNVQSYFTMPVVKFLQGLIETKRTKNSKYREIAEFLEKNILKGKVISKEGVITDYTYQPYKSKKNLPFYITSSLVSELSPLIIFLNSNTHYRSLIIEEPEAHLHPEMQRVIVCAMSRLVRKGLPIWCTTHSDTIFQQVNNLIKLSHHKNKKELMEKYEYENEDLIDKNDVKAYQFIDDGGTVVKPLKLTSQGFEVPTFNESLISLANETIDLGE